MNIVPLPLTDVHNTVHRAINKLVSMRGFIIATDQEYINKSV